MKKSGFSLIESMVVIAIVGGLAAVAVPSAARAMALRQMLTAEPPYNIQIVRGLQLGSLAFLASHGC